MLVSAICGRSISCGGQQLVSKGLLSGSIIAKALAAKRFVNYRAECSKDGTSIRPPKNKTKSMWLNPECCLDPCPDLQPRFDELYYKPSDKMKRKYTQTWVECPKIMYARKKICCYDNIIPPAFERRMHKRRKASEECKPRPTDLMPCKTMSRSICPKFVLPGCTAVRDPAKCGRPRPKRSCVKICTPYPSFSECTKKKPRPPRSVECRCLDIPSMCDVFRLLKRAHGHRKI
ncbi:uncharacterized protein LOC101452096 [Ceratitis capitata]|uniref:Uncharacterized protein n=1 Tax=Ceratitis capitata TaxID=7213 RepID=W8BUI9_CERCA|nr:uncharacterized protein LOC101452096 [Ceratitis capitata]